MANHQGGQNSEEAPVWYRRSLVIGPEGGFGAWTGGISVDLTVHQSKDFPALCCHFRPGIQGDRVQSQERWPPQECPGPPPLGPAVAKTQPALSPPSYTAQGRRTSARRRGLLFSKRHKGAIGPSRGLAGPLAPPWAKNISKDYERISHH